MNNRDDNNIAYAHNLANEYTSVGGNGVTHDDAGNLTTDDSGYVYSYDYENRLTEITDSSEDTVATFSYDALGRRIEKIEYASGSPSSTTRFYYDGWRVLSETNESDTTERQYIYGNYLDEVLLMVIPAGQANSGDHYYAHDHLFSPAALLDDMGAVEEYYEFDAYGKMKVYYDAGADSAWLTADDDTDTASHHANPIAFTGQRLDNLDSNSLLIMYYKNRYYLPEQGRFMQRDPLGVNDGLDLAFYFPTGTVHLRSFKPIVQYAKGIILYEYCLDNPVNSIDSLGLKVKSITGEGLSNLGDSCVDAIVKYTVTSIADGISKHVCSKNVVIECSPKKCKPSQRVFIKGKYEVRYISQDRNMFGPGGMFNDMASGGYPTTFPPKCHLRHVVIKKICRCPCSRGTGWKIIHKYKSSTEDENDWPEATGMYDSQSRSWKERTLLMYGCSDLTIWDYYIRLNSINGWTH